MGFHKVPFLTRRLLQNPAPYSFLVVFKKSAQIFYNRMSLLPPPGLSKTP